MRFMKAVLAALLLCIILTGCAAPTKTDGQTAPTEATEQRSEAITPIQDETVPSVPQQDGDAASDDTTTTDFETTEPSESVSKSELPGAPSEDTAGTTEPNPTEQAPPQPQPTEPKPTEPAPTAHTHRYSASTVAPTCTAQGYTLHSCSCGDSYKDSYTAALGHDYRDTVVAPTASAQGYTEHTCARCGDSYRDSYTDPVRWDTPERVAQVCTDLNAYISSIGLTVDPNAEGWTSPQVTSYYTESEFRSRMIEFINWYKEQGFTNLRVTYESNGDGSFTFYVKYNIVSG